MTKPNRTPNVTQLNSVVHYAALVFAILFLTACVSNAPKPIDTSEHFTSQVNAQGEVQFAFGLKWLNDIPQQALRSGQGREADVRNDIRQGRFADGETERFNQQPSNQTKLMLEEKAATKLQKTLEKNQLCPHGYKVEQVIWESQRIRLMGRCETD